MGLAEGVRRHRWWVSGHADAILPCSDLRRAAVVMEEWPENLKTTVRSCAVEMGGEG